jgi:hypothetical protein
VNQRDDEYIFITVSFLKNRFSTRQVGVSTDPFFDETFIFEFQGENENIKFDPSMLLKLNQPLHLTILKQRRNEKAAVIGTKNIEWRSLLYCNRVELNAEVLPVDLKHQRSLGVVQLHLDIIPALTQTELLHDEGVYK